MKIIDAFWEKRNLGVNCYEISFTKDDTLFKVKQEYEHLSEREYMVVKIPSYRYDIVQYFQKLGYYFIETAISLENQLDKFEPDGKFSQIQERCRWEIMDDLDKEELIKQIRNNIFHTDRVYVDSYFTKENAAKRYECWLGDIEETDGFIYKVMYMNKTVGFQSFQLKGEIGHGILAGVYEKFQRTGMGYCIVYSQLMQMKKLGAKKFITNISGSNPDILQLHLASGTKITQMEYVFVKHIKFRKEDV